MVFIKGVRVRVKGLANRRNLGLGYLWLHLHPALRVLPTNLGFRI